MFSLHLPKFHLINGNMGQKQERTKFGIAEIDTQKHLVPPYIQLFSLKRYLKPKEKILQHQQIQMQSDVFTPHRPSERHYYL